jgi:hypothetical protein
MYPSKELLDPFEMIGLGEMDLLLIVYLLRKL